MGSGAESRSVAMVVTVCVVVAGRRTGSYRCRACRQCEHTCDDGEHEVSMSHSSSPCLLAVTARTQAILRVPLPYPVYRLSTIRPLLASTDSFYALASGSMA